jgi:hypothetical protein
MNQQSPAGEEGLLVPHERDFRSLARPHCDAHDCDSGEQCVVAGPRYRNEGFVLDWPPIRLVVVAAPRSFGCGAKERQPATHKTSNDHNSFMAKAGQL